MCIMKNHHYKHALSTKVMCRKTRKFIIEDFDVCVIPYLHCKSSVSKLHSAYAKIIHETTRSKRFYKKDG